MSPARRDGFWCGALATLVAVAFVFPLLGHSGVWDPFELDRGDLARRVSVATFGATNLPGGDVIPPTLTDIGRGELATTSIALSFRLFGLHDWAGRLPMALWGLAAAIAIYTLLARTVAPRAGLYAVIALSTMPIFFVQARTMLGDVVPMAAFALALSGLAGALLDEGWWPRAAWLVVGAGGLASAFLSAGVLAGVAPPTLAVAIGWAASRGLRSSDRFGDIGAAVLGAAGCGALAVGLVVLDEQVAQRSYREVLLDAFQAAGHFPATPYPVSPPVSRWLGASLLPDHPIDATFDRVLRQLGHALFPWSALLPFAIGRLFRSPVGPEAGRGRDASVRLVILLGIGMSWAAVTFLVPYCGSTPFAGVPLLAAAIGIAIHDGERGAPPSRAGALLTLLLLAVLYRDLAASPGQSFSAFGVDGAEFPESFAERGTALLLASALAFGLVAALALFEKDTESRGGSLRSWARRRVAAYLEVVTELATVWKGNLLFAFVVLEAALVGLAAMIFVGGRYGWEPVTKLPRNFAALGVNLWWAVPIVLATFAPVLVVVRDGFRAAVGWSRAPRARAVLLAGLLSGFLLGFDYYPTLGSQLSPKEVFSSYASLAKPDEHLALLGVNPRAAAYYEGDPTYVFPEAKTAGQWLGEEAPARRWLVVTADNLPEVNATYRAVHRRNVPVLDGRSSQVLLLSNRLDGAQNQSWLDAMLLDEAPRPLRGLNAKFQDELEAIGWDVTDEQGRPVEAVVPGDPYRLRFYYRVLREIKGQWKAFVHIDGQSKRYNADHAVLEGRYPMSLLLPGDFVCDDVELRLEPNFTPGPYHLYFGFFRGSLRMKVTDGAQREDRAYGGVLRVL